MPSKNTELSMRSVQYLVEVCALTVNAPVVNEIPDSILKPRVPLTRS